MESVREITKLTVFNVVDNETDALSSPCQCCEPDAEPQVASYFDNIMTVISQGNGEVAELQRMCLAAHGLSLLLIAEYVDELGNVQEEHLLFDAGPDPSVWSQNAQKLRVDIGKISRVVLSHYHMDHFGGFNSAIPDIVAAKEGRDCQTLVVDLSSPVITERGIKNVLTGDMMKLLPDTPTLEETQSWGAQVELHDKPHNGCNDCFYVSDYIPRVTSYETGLPNHWSKMDGEFVLDPDVKDERYVAVKIKGRGVVVFSSCSHAGIVNVCQDVTNQFGGSKLVAVIGGFHLAGRNTEDRITSTIAGLKELDPDLILAGHCTGWKAKAKFAASFEYNFQVLSVGGRYTFNSM